MFTAIVLPRRKRLSCFWGHKAEEFGNMLFSLMSQLLPLFSLHIFYKCLSSAGRLWIASSQVPSKLFPYEGMLRDGFHKEKTIKQ